MNVENWMLPCIFKTATGMNCPWCGFQRGFLELLNGNMLESIGMFPPLIPLAALVCALILRIQKPTNYRLKGIYASFGLVVITLLLNFFLKNS